MGVSFHSSVQPVAFFNFCRGLFPTQSCRVRFRPLLLLCFTLRLGEKSLNVFGPFFLICCHTPSQ
jgi:hypothetical protein